jgi:hypothetical protein
MKLSNKQFYINASLIVSDLCGGETSLIKGMGYDTFME